MSPPCRSLIRFLSSFLSGHFAPIFQRPVFTSFQRAFERIIGAEILNLNEPVSDLGHDLVCLKTAVPLPLITSVSATSSLVNVTAASHAVHGSRGHPRIPRSIIKWRCCWQPAIMNIHPLRVTWHSFSHRNLRPFSPFWANAVALCQ